MDKSGDSVYARMLPQWAYGGNPLISTLSAYFMVLVLLRHRKFLIGCQGRRSRLFTLEHPAPNQNPYNGLVKPH